MQTIDELLLAVAQQEGAAEFRDLAVFADPHLAAAHFALEHLRSRDDARLFLGARDIGQAYATMDLAEVGAGSDADASLSDVSDRLFVAGYQSEIQLDIFFDDARSGFGGRIAPAELGLVLTHLPKSLEELRYIAQSVAYGSGGSELTFVAVGNNKHMTRAQNEVLASCFEEVYASRGRGKFRCLVARRPRADVAPYAPSTARYQLPAAQVVRVGAGSAETSAVERTIFGVGGVFSGAKPDRGGELLAATAVADLRNNETFQARLHSLPLAVDLGCGNAIGAVALASAFLQLRIHATDISADAVCSAHLTLLSEILDRRAKVKWDDAARSLPEGSAQVVLLNPPFHKGTEVDRSLAGELVAAARRILQPRGEGLLYFVHNNHLRYRPLLEAQFAEVDELARNAKFTVLRARTA